MSKVISDRKTLASGAAWQRLRAEERGVRARETARNLCTSEAKRWRAPATQGPCVSSVDSVHVYPAWVEQGLGKASFPLIGDVTRRLAQSFCVLLEDEGVARATFVLDPERGS